MADIKEIRPLTPEWYAYCYEKMNGIMAAVWRCRFPVNVFMWAWVVPLVSIMFTVAVIKHKLRGC